MNSWLLALTELSKKKILQVEFSVFYDPTPREYRICLFDCSLIKMVIGEITLPN